MTNSLFDSFATGLFTNNLDPMHCPIVRVSNYQAKGGSFNLLPTTTQVSIEAAKACARGKQDKYCKKGKGKNKAVQ